MAADAREAVRRLPGVRRVSVQLQDHYTGGEINDALRRGKGFTGAFPARPTTTTSVRCASLQRKALIARQSKLCEALLAGGATPEQVVAQFVGELPDVPEARRCLELRAQLGIESQPDSPAFVLPSGEPLAADQLMRWLRMARLVRTSLETNCGICRSLLQVRHQAGGRSRGGCKMKAARLHAYHEALKLDSVEEPKALGPLDVVVRIGAAGLCRTDLHIQEGQWAEKSGVALPYTPGHENAGWVHEIGSAVTNVERGDTVIVHPFHLLRTVSVVPSRRRHALPEGFLPGHQPRRWVRRLPAHLGPVGRQARPVTRAQGHRGARRCRARRSTRSRKRFPF